MNSLNENIRPYQSCSKSVFLVLGIIFISWISLFSIFLIVQGAWPVSIFLGLEYLVIFYLIRLYFKEKNIKDEININQKEISIKKYEAFKYSLIIILVEVLGLYKNSKIALFIIT